LDQPVTSKDSVFQREVEDMAEDVQQEVEQKLLGEEIINILEELDPGYRALIVLCDIQGYSYQEISDILNLSLGTVKSRLHRARNMIRRLLPSEHFSTSFVKKGERREAL
jgi:RNA polymerase sigma factor (sigma-70 family)